MQLDLDISRDITKEKPKDMEISDFIKELSEKSRKLEIANKNFINELQNEFNIPDASLEKLQNKINDYISEIPWGETIYIGYDLKTDKYYQDYFNFNEYHRFELTKKEAEDFGVGTIYTVASTGPESDAPDSFTKADYAKKAIRLSIEEQLNDGKNIDDVNLFELKDDFKKVGYVASIYERYQERNNIKKKED